MAMRSMIMPRSRVPSQRRHRARPLYDRVTSKWPSPITVKFVLEGLPCASLPLLAEAT
jgi:hypothetical protein